METKTLEPLMLRAKQAAKFIGVSERTLHNLRAMGKLPLPIRLNRCCLWRRSDLELWTQSGCPNVDKFIQMKKEFQK